MTFSLHASPWVISTSFGAHSCNDRVTLQLCHVYTRRPLHANDHDVGEHASREIWHVSRGGVSFLPIGSPWGKNEKQANCVVYPAFGDELTFGKGSTNETGNVPTTWHRVLITGECFYRCLGDKLFIFVPWRKRTGRKSTSSGWVRIQNAMILSRAVEVK